MTSQLDRSGRPNSTAPPPGPLGASAAAAAASVLDALPEMVHVYDAEWRWVHLNPPAAEWVRSLGHDPRRLPGRCVWEEFPDAKRSPLYKAALRAVRDACEVVVESRERDREHETRIIPHPEWTLTLTRDVTERNREARRRAFVAEAGTVFIDTLAPEQVLQRLLRVAAATIADYGIAYVVEGDRLRRVAIAHADPTKEPLLHELERVAPLGADNPVVRSVFARAEPRWIFPVKIERLVTGPEHERILRTLALRSAVMAPFTVQGQPVGFLAVGTCDGGRPPLTEADSSAMGEVARRSGMALAAERSRRRAEAAADRMERLQQATAALSRALPREEVVDLVVAQAMEATGARMGAVLELTADGRALVLVRHVGLPPALAAGYACRPVARPTPAGDVARTGASVFLESPEAWRARYGDPPPDALRGGDGAWAALPLLAEGGLIGVLKLGFSTARSFAPDDREFLAALAQQCARALERARLHDAVLEAAERLRAVVETAADGIITIDEAGTIESVNPATERIFGYAREEVVGRNVRMLMPEPYHGQHDGYIARYLETGTPRVIGIGREVVGRRKDGTEFPMDLAVSETPLPRRRLFTGIVRDATERKRAEAALREAKARLELILAGVRDGITVQGPDGELVYANEEAARMMGYPSAAAFLAAPRTELLERFEILDEHGRPFPLDRLPGRLALQGEEPPDTLLCWRERGSGESRWTMVHAGAARGDDGRPLLVVNVFHDLTDRVRQQQALEEASAQLEAVNAELEHTVGELTARKEEAESARAAAEAANQAKSQFLGVMSHELRTPLNSVIGYSDLLLLETKGPLTEGQRQQAERIKTSARHQLGLIEEILTYVRIEAGREDLRKMTVNVERVLRDVAEFVRPQAERRGLRLELEAGDALEVQTDPGRLRQVLLNLAGNAVKFTEAGSVTLSARREGGGIAIRVHDTGPGIPPEQHAAVWEPFTQVDSSRTREAGGTGLGLAIVRRLVELMGGTVELESGGSRGSTFTVRLPERS